MSSKRLDSIDRLARYNYALGVRCRSCGHQAKLDPRQITEEAEKRGQSRDMAAIGQRLRCKNCGKRDVSFGPIAP
jgi:ribosomal protein S27E